MNGIFISYRRGGAGSHAAGRISKYLGDRFGAELVFFDVQDIAPGRDFDDAIDNALTQCHALVVVIDGHWIATDQLQRLHDPKDYVRREIAAALGRDVLVLPVLIDAATMPLESLLPGCLQPLCKCQALPLRHTSFEPDIGPLIEAIDQRYEELEALRNSMQCPHCRAAIRVSPGERLAKCRSCGTDVGVLRVVLSAPDATGTSAGRDLSRLLKLAAIDVDNERYRGAYEQYSRILAEYPDSWEALINQSICLFWLGSEDLGHLPEVFALLDKGDLLSNQHPRVRATRQSLAYNLAALAAAEEMVGHGISWSLDLFEFSRQLEPEDRDRDQLVDSYVEACFQGIEKRLRELLQRDAKNFDPPLAEISTLRRLMSLGRSRDVIRFFILMADRKLQVSQNRQELPEQLEAAKKELERLYPNTPPQRIAFPLFGAPRIEEV